ncbi:hypothetical protein [Enterococcus bulliens]
MKKDELNQYDDVKQQLDYLVWSIKKDEMELSRWLEGELSQIEIENNFRLDDLENNIQNKKENINQLMSKEREFYLKIEALEGIEKTIAKMKYIEKLGLREIAERLQYSDTYIRQKNAQILDKINFLDRYVEKAGLKKKR